MNRLISILLASSTSSFVSSESQRFSGGSNDGAVVWPKQDPFAQSPFDRVIGFTVLALVVSIPSAYIDGLTQVLPFLGR